MLNILNTFIPSKIEYFVQYTHLEHLRSRVILVSVFTNDSLLRDGVVFGVKEPVLRKKLL